LKLLLTKLQHAIPIFNVDATKNSAGNIMHVVDLMIEYQGHHEKVTAEVTDLRKNALILGFTWLKHHNPEIDWVKGSITMTHCPRHCHTVQDKRDFIQRIEKEEKHIQYQVHAMIHALELQVKMDETAEKLIPSQYHDYLKVFSKAKSERMPIRKPWDHTIDMKETFMPKKGQIIPLFATEQEEVTVFLDDQLKKGYIHPSKSPQTSLVFFIPKKDDKKRMVQDY